MRTREGMKVARAKGRLRGKQPKLSPRQEAHLVALHQAGTHTSAELAELFSVARSTVYRASQGHRARTGRGDRTGHAVRQCGPTSADVLGSPRQNGH